jgi:dTDP-L-rhamnose 4-epimerase
MSKTLITGGAGFIGSALALKLQSLNREVVIFDNLSKQIHGADPKKTSATFSKVKNFKNLMVGDVRDRQALRKALEGVDSVVHLAAETGTGQSMYDIANYCEVNIQGTALLLEEILQLKTQVKKIVVASSRAVYGEGQYRCKTHGLINPGPRQDKKMKQKLFNHYCAECDQELEQLATSEKTSTRPQSIYGVTKLSQEQLVLNAAKASDIDAVALRFQNVYGPGQALSNPYTGILSIFSTRSLENKPIAIFEDGIESRDFVYIDDIVQSIVSSLDYNKSGQHIFNVGSGVKTSVNEVVKEIVSFFNSDSKITVTGEYRIGDIRHNHADLSDIQKELGFKPTIYFKEGVHHFLIWVLSQDKAQDGYEKSLEELRSRGLLK